MTHQEALAELPSYLLDDLDPEEIAALETHLANCPRCSAEHDRLAAVLGGLGTLAPDVEPPPALRQRVLDAIDASSAPATLVMRPELDGASDFVAPVTRLTRLSRWSLLAAAAVILVLSGATGLLYQQWSQTRHQLDATREQSEEVHDVLTKPTTSIALVADNAKDAYGTLYIGEDGRQAVMLVEQLPPTPGDRLYQIWLVQNGQRTSAGVFTVDQSGTAQILIQAPKELSNYQSLGITLEPRPNGSPGPTGARVVSCPLNTHSG